MPITADRDEIIQQNMGLVHACAHKFKGRGIEYEDLFQAGCMGLILSLIHIFTVPPDR